MSVASRQWVALLAVALVPAYAAAYAAARTTPGATVGAGAGTTELHAQPLRRAHGARGRTTWDSVFSAEQATRGQATYGRTCARCHQASLSGADESPALTGGAFMSSWNGQTLGELHSRVRTSMPTDTPGTYSRKDVADVIAYVLRFNGFPAGAVELPADDGALQMIVFAATKP